MCGYRRKVSGLISDPEHAHGKWRQQIRIGQRVGKTPAIANLLVQRSMAATSRGPPVITSRRILSAAGSATPLATRRPSVPMILAVRRSRIGPAISGPTEDSTMRALRSPGQRRAKRRGRQRSGKYPRNRSRLPRSHSEAPRTKAAPELRRPPRSLNTGSNCGTTIDQKENENENGRPDQKQRITDRRVEAFAKRLAPGSVLDDCPQYRVELAGGLARPHHGDVWPAR